MSKAMPGRPPRRGRLTLMDPKPRPNRQTYMRALARMSPSAKAAKVFELSDDAKARFRDGIRVRFPYLTDAGRHLIYLERMAACHNRNY